MVPYKGTVVIPEVTEEICIGCGACEHVCPAEPYLAIYIESNNPHKIAEKPKVEKKTPEKKETVPVLPPRIP